MTKSYTPLPALLDSSNTDVTLPPFWKLTMPTTVTLLLYLDTERPLSEPKWAKTGDVQEWLRSMFGRMFWVAGDAAEGWEKKIQVVDPDPVCPPHSKCLNIAKYYTLSPQRSGQSLKAGQPIRLQALSLSVKNSSKHI